MELKKYTRVSPSIPRVAIAISSALFGAQFISAQVDDEEDVFDLSPFTVGATEDNGYRATSTLAGTRLKTSLKDVGSSISVMTGEFLSDTGSNSAEDALVYAVNTEVAGQGGNFLGEGAGAIADNTTRRDPVANTRVRGLAAADNTRNFYLSDIPWDSYNITRVDLQRGANAILFGIGSPAGIVNVGLQTASFEDEGQVEVGFGSYGSMRLSGNFNKVLVEDELAIRIAVLNDDKKYRQDPAFRDDQRLFAALDWRPASMSSDSYNTELSANFESGSIEGNRPRLLPPMDAITPWFGPLAKATFEGPTAEADRVSNNWLNAPGQRLFDGIAIAFDGGQQGMAFVSQNNPWPNTGGATPTGGNIVGIQTFNQYAGAAGLLGADLGAHKAKSLTDTSIFDFKNRLLEGDNKREFNDFDALNLTFRQNFANNKFGYELAYDKQKAEWGIETALSDDAAIISIDVMETLMDGSPNPNVGRPYTIAGGGSAQGFVQTSDRENFRATAYAQLDFTENSNDTLGSILGKHTFSALYSTNEIVSSTRDWSPWYIGQSYGPNSGSAIGQAARDAIVIAYLGDSLAGASSAAGANLSAITGNVIPQSTSVTTWDNVANAWVSTPLEIVNANAMDTTARAYRRGSKYSEKITSNAIIWQGSMFDGLFVPMVGYREDEDTARNAGNAPAGSLGGTIDFFDPSFVITGDGNTEKGDSLTSGAVFHMPKSFKDNLGFDLSFHYSKSENFRPDAGRRDVRGNAIPSPVGETEDYGFSISAFEDRLILKVTEYDTVVSNSTVAGQIGGNYLIGAIEAWGQQYAVQARDGTGSFTNSFGTSSSGGTLRYQPVGDPLGVDGAYSQAQIDATYATQQAAISAWLADPVPADFQEAWALTGYSAGAGQTNFGAAGLAVTADTFASGTEFELIYNPTDNLTISLNATNSSAQQDNLASAYSEWVLARWDDFQGAQGDIRLWGPSEDFQSGGGGESVRGKFGRETMSGINLWLALVGSDVPELVKRRYNAVVNYSFTDGKFDGLNIGGSLRTADAPTVGFPVVANDQGTLTFDVANPYKGDRETNVDFWVGYEKSLSDTIDWRIQFNLRNAFESSELYPVSVQPDGTPGAYRISAPTTWTLTNSFSF